MKYAALFLALSILLTACGAQPTGTPTTAPQPATPTAVVSPTATQPAAPTTAPTPNDDQSRAAVVNALLAISLKPNRMEVTTRPVGGKEQKNTIDFLPPDRKYLYSTDGEYVIVAGKVYLKNAGMTSWQDPGIPAANFIPNPPPTASDVEKTIGDVHFLRAESVNGKPALLFGYNTTQIVGSLTIHSRVQLWLAADTDGLPIQMVTDGDVYSLSSDSNGKTTEVAAKATTTSLFDFAASIQIEAPAQ